jgi:pSer/pThr/pTyr-binding forkhead associated (FHA) protein
MHSDGTSNFGETQRVTQRAHHSDELADTLGEGDTAEPMGRVIVATEGRTTQELSLKFGRIIIGRTSDNDLQVDSRFVSRHHCQIITGAEGSVIEDLNSTNGIFVQGKRVRRHNLNDGDIVVIGKHEIMYVYERLAQARVNPAERAGVPTLDEATDDRSHIETVVDSEHDANEKPAAGRAANSAK